MSISKYCKDHKMTKEEYFNFKHNINEIVKALLQTTFKQYKEIVYYRYTVYSAIKGFGIYQEFIYQGLKQKIDII